MRETSGKKAEEKKIRKKGKWKTLCNNPRRAPTLERSTSLSSSFLASPPPPPSPGVAPLGLALLAKGKGFFFFFSFLFFFFARSELSLSPRLHHLQSMPLRGCEKKHHTPAASPYARTHTATCRLVFGW